MELRLDTLSRHCVYSVFDAFKILTTFTLIYQSSERCGLVRKTRKTFCSIVNGKVKRQDSVLLVARQLYQRSSYVGCIPEFASIDQLVGGVRR